MVFTLVVGAFVESYGFPLGYRRYETFQIRSSGWISRRG